jgi:hypothetical protein
MPQVFLDALQGNSLFGVIHYSIPRVDRGHLARLGTRKKGYDHEITRFRGRLKNVSRTLPRVDRVASLLKVRGTHQGAVSYQHLPYYLDDSLAASTDEDLGVGTLYLCSKHLRPHPNRTQ